MLREQGSRATCRRVVGEYVPMLWEQGSKRALYKDFRQRATDAAEAGLQARAAYPLLQPILQEQGET